MAQNLPERTLYDFIVGDFEDAWNALAQTAAASFGHRGNFMFARQAMTLLEFAARLCKSDPTGTALKDFTLALNDIDPLYYTSLPGVCCNGDAEFDLPSVSGLQPSTQLLWALFDLIRNGQAHQYQQILLKPLLDGAGFVIALTGVCESWALSRILASGRATEHLCYERDKDNDLVLHVRTEWLFLDIKHAIESANLLRRIPQLTLAFLQRPRSKAHYQFTSAALEASLKGGGHTVC